MAAEEEIGFGQATTRLPPATFGLPTGVASNDLPTSFPFKAKDSAMNELEKPVPITAPPGAPDFLVHDEGDHVGIAVHDVDPGPRSAVYMDSDRLADITLTESIPLGHKVALVDMASDAEVIEYRVVVGRTRNAIARGQMVHVHNLRSARWEGSK